MKNEDGEEEEVQMGESVKGSYSYKDDEGKTYSITYTADENGYRPVRIYTSHLMKYSKKFIFNILT